MLDVFTLEPRPFCRPASNILAMKAWCGCFLHATPASRIKARVAGLEPYRERGLSSCARDVNVCSLTRFSFRVRWLFLGGLTSQQQASVSQGRSAYKKRTSGSGAIS